jgi:orotidine-5'-phosphate decarboxylase
LVIGAREGDAFVWAARLVPQAQLLVPGIGAQGGTASELGASLSASQRNRVVVNVSRAVIHASQGADFAKAARNQALAFREALREALSPRSVRDDASATR